MAPLQAFSVEKARDYRGRLEAAEAERGGKLHDDEKRKLHLYLKWVNDIVRDPVILDAVEDLIGPDILVFHLTCWIKEPKTGSFISWHQDSTYFGLDPSEHITAWVALSESDFESGCVKVVPGSHARGQIVHAVGAEQQNMLGIGQELELSEADRTEAMVLRPGEFSLHHTHLIHGSMPNRSSDRRIGLGISYVPTHVRCNSRTRLSAMLVRGVDEFGHFDHEPHPQNDFDPAAVAAHSDAMRRWHEARREIIGRVNADAAAAR